jgi:hypothetical protein
MGLLMAAAASHDDEFDLDAVVARFVASGARVWHVDRHVVEVDADVPVAERESACGAAIELATRWMRARRALRNDILVSVPYAIVDDEWILRAPAATPPHVYVCIARDAEAFAPVEHVGRTDRYSGIAALDRWLVEGTHVVRVEGAYTGEPGAWVVCVNADVSSEG